MATKWKNYNSTFRIIAIFTAIVTAFTGCCFVYLAAINSVAFDSKHTKSFYDTPYFLYYTYRDINAVSYYAEYNNEKYTTTFKQQLDDYQNKYSELKQEQKKLEIKLEQMLWLQNNLPDGANNETFQASVFIDCNSPEEYLSAFDTFCTIDSEDNFYNLINTAEPIPDDVIKTTSSEVSEQKSAAVTAPARYDSAVAVTRYDYNEADEDNYIENIKTGKTLSDSHIPSVWLYYYCTIRNELTAKVGDPITSENVYNYSSLKASEAPQNEYSAYYYSYNFSKPENVKYLYVCKETNEYITNDSDLTPDSDKNILIKTDNKDDIISKFKDKMHTSEWSGYIEDGITSKSLEKNNKQNFSNAIGIFNTGLSLDKTQGNIYIYSNLSYSDLSEASDSYEDIYSYAFSVYQHNISRQNIFTVLAIISVIIYLLNALYIFTAGTVKKTAMDKLYNDWHFILSVCFTIAAFVGSVWFLKLTWAEINISTVFLPYLSILICVCTALCLLILLEYVTSVIRNGRRGELVRHSAWYALFAFFARKIKTAKNKRLKRSPEYLKKQFTIALTVGIICSVISIIISLFAYLPGVIITVIMDVLLLTFVLTNIKALDLIIEAAAKIRDGDYSVYININQIPNHLRGLACDILHNRDGIKHAIDKSVKDERMKAELITNVSHDLKTPLTSVVTYVDLLKKCDIQDERAKEYIDIIEEKAARLKKLIEDLTEASKASTGNLRLNKLNVNLYEMAIQAIGENSDDLAKQNIDIIINDPVGETIVYADNQQTWRIIDNLFSNAKKYAMPGTRIYMDVREINGKGVLSMKNVSKYQLNIDPEELTQRFVRGDDSRTSEGSGLGLSIAKSICELQNGVFRIDIDGDLFKATVILPKAYKTEKQDSVAADNTFNSVINNSEEKMYTAESANSEEIL